VKISALGSSSLASGGELPAVTSHSFLKEKPSVLLLSPHEEDHDMLSRAFDNMAWQVHHSYDLEGSGTACGNTPSRWSSVIASSRAIPGRISLSNSRNSRTPPHW